MTVNDTLSIPNALKREHPKDYYENTATIEWPLGPDRPRRRAPEHFVNLPRNATALGDDGCPLAEKCAVTAIEDDFAVLASSDATDEEKLEALKFLGHWVGDIHQPLHVSFEDDRGGNSVSAQGSSCDNLHAVWDRCIVEERLGMHPVALVGAPSPETSLRTEMLGRIENISRELSELREALEAIKP
jgi:hypothetical protein